ncbi:MAG: PDZ domain-containing protein [Gemmatimonadota bacterium]|jgi:predicted metalloprotease with PDZ domain
MTGTDSPPVTPGRRRPPPSRRGVLTAVFAGLALAGLPTASAAQEAAVYPGASGSGWLGVNVHVITSPERPEGVITLADVLPESPAAQAGLRPGDRVIALNGVPVTAERFRSLTRRLQAGDPTALTVLRGGEELRVSVVAGQRPAPSQIVAVRLQEELDSVRSRFVRILHEAPEAAPGEAAWSAELRFEAPTIQVEQVGSDSIATRIWIRSPGDGTVSEVFVEAPEGVHTVTLEELPALVGARGPESMNVVVLREEQAAREAADQARSSARTLSSRQAVEAAAARERQLRSLEEVRPLSPFVAGLTRVAGAELRSVNPALGRYFGVDRGLLVTEVAEGSPAAAAGLRGGDVIVTAGGRDVTTLRELRAALMEPEGKALEVVRRGERLSLRLP